VDIAVDELVESILAQGHRDDPLPGPDRHGDRDDLVHRGSVHHLGELETRCQLAVRLVRHPRLAEERPARHDRRRRQQSVVTG